MFYTKNLAITGAAISVFDQLFISQKPLSLKEVAQSSIKLGRFGIALDIADEVSNPTCQLDSKTEKVWKKAKKSPFYNPDKIRLDKYDNLIKKCDYGDRTIETAWEKDHIKAKANGGNDELKNLQPLQWLENAKKGRKKYYRKKS